MNPSHTQCFVGGMLVMHVFLLVLHVCDTYRYLMTPFSLGYFGAMHGAWACALVMGYHARHACNNAPCDWAPALSTYTAMALVGAVAVALTVRLARLRLRAVKAGSVV